MVNKCNFKCWKKKKSQNPYHHDTWVNEKKALTVTIISDIGFGKQRNVLVENYNKIGLSGPEVIFVKHEKNQKDAMEKANSYMKMNDECK